MARLALCHTAPVGSGGGTTRKRDRLGYDELGLRLDRAIGLPCMGLGSHVAIVEVRILTQSGSGEPLPLTLNAEKRIRKRLKST